MTRPACKNSAQTESHPGHGTRSRRKGSTRPRPNPRTAPFVGACLFALASLHLACGDISDSPDAAGPVVETETIGDTTVVRTVSGSVWKGSATLVPEVAVGELDGPEEYLFGSVGAIAVDDDHNFYILDEQAYNVRVFDSAGSYVTTLGRGGEGPGEFKVPVGIAISDGRVLVRDPANGRVQLFDLEPLRYDVFEADGTYLGAVEMPEELSLAAPPVFGRSFVWAVERGDLDVQRVRRYRIASADGGPI